tara:strand:+ start:5643 stop:6245 length:603 start_codon:yes stop_codon:yes gene_type:complete
MQVADPAVSRRKFDREVAQLRDLGSTLVARGMWVMQAEFPVVKVAFATVNCRPWTIPFAVRIDFTDYDVQPLAITFVEPFTDRELMPAEMQTKLLRAMPGEAVQQIEVNGQPVAMQMAMPQLVELYQHYPQMPHIPGFLCLPGTRAYHAHPAHTGDPWEIHRAVGEGKLFNLLETVWRYGTAPINQVQVNLGLAQSEIPA